MLKAIIIDDEKTSRDALMGLISRYCANVEVIDQANGYKSGLEAIRNQNADIVFLDIQMPDGSGFQLLEDLKETNFEIIFTTAYDQYAIKAIKYSALDYLLKPVVPSDLINAIQKAEKKKTSGTMSGSIEVLLENIKTKTEPKKIVLSTSDKINVVDIEDIVRCESDGYYTRFYLLDGTQLIISKTLKEYETLLGDKIFLRPHKSHLINIRFIKGYLRDDSGYIIMNDDSKIPVSRRKRENVILVINNL